MSKRAAPGGGVNCSRMSAARATDGVWGRCWDAGRAFAARAMVMASKATAAATVAVMKALRDGRVWDISRSISSVRRYFPTRTIPQERGMAREFGGLHRDLGICTGSGR